MRTLLAILAAAILAVAFVPQPAFAGSDDDVFIDEGGAFDDPPTVPGYEDDKALGPEFQGTSDDKAKQEEPAPTVADDSAPAAYDEAPEAAPEKPAKPAKAKPKAKAKVAKKAEKAPKRKTASKGGFRMLNGDCDLHADADASSAVVLKATGPKKLWIEDHDGDWVKGYHRGGHGYFSSACFQ